MNSLADLVIVYQLSNAVTVFQIVLMILMNMIVYSVDQVGVNFTELTLSENGFKARF